MMRENQIIFSFLHLAPIPDTLKAVLEKKIYEVAGISFNIQSPKQLGEILFERLKLTGGKKTKTGFSTRQEVLEELAFQHPLPAVILETPRDSVNSV